MEYYKQSREKGVQSFGEGGRLLFENQGDFQQGGNWERPEGTDGVHHGISGTGNCSCRSGSMPGTTKRPEERQQSEQEQESLPKTRELLGRRGLLITTCKTL